MIKRLFITLLFAITLVFPITKAFAVLPLIYLAYAAVAGAELTPWVAGSTTLVGAAIAILNFKKQATATAASPAIQITLDPNTPLITPPNWTAPATGTQEPTPPQENAPTITATIPAGMYDGQAHTFTGASMNAVKASVLAYLQPNYTGYTLELQYDAAENKLRLFENSPPQTEMNNYVNFSLNNDKCKAGYTLDAAGNTCNLTNPQQVQKPADHICEMVKSSTGTFTPSATDPDCANATIAGNNTAKLEYTVSETEHLIIQNDNNGKVTITQKAYNASENKTSAYTATLSTARVVTATTTTNAPGNTLADTGTGTGTGGTSGETTVVNFPNDYSKTGEAQTAANSIISKLDPLTSTTGAADGSATDPTFSDGFGETFNALTAWQLPLHTSTCPTAQFTVWNHQFNLNAQCTVFNDVKTPLSFAMVAAWVILALFIVLGA